MTTPPVTSAPQLCPREIHAAGWPPLVPTLQLIGRPGTFQQRTWYVRRAVTILGSRPSAHVLIRHEEVSKAHAAIICDGSNPLICDLASRNGTYLNGRPVGWAVLQHGDVLRVGPMDFRVHAQPLPGSRGRNVESSRFEAMLPCPELRLIDDDGNTALAVREGAVVVGARTGAALRVAEPAPPAVAILTAWKGGWAVYDLAHDDEPRTTINGAPVLSSVLREGDRLCFGRTVYYVVLQGGGCMDGDAARPATSQATLPTWRDAESGPSSSSPPGSGGPRSFGSGQAQLPSEEIDPMHEEDMTQTVQHTPQREDGSDGLLNALETRLASLQTDLANSYQRLHQFQLRLDQKAVELALREQQLGQRTEAVQRQETELTARAAAVEQREKELAAATAELERNRSEIERLRDELTVAQQQLASQRCDLETQQKRLAQASADLEHWKAELERLSLEVAAGNAELEERRRSLERERQAIEALQRECETAKADVRQQQERLQADQQALEARMREAEAQAARLEARAAQLAEREATLAEREQAAAVREQAVDDREKKLAVREELCARQEASVEAFQLALTDAMSGFQPPAVPTADVGDAPPPGPESTCGLPVAPGPTAPAGAGGDAAPGCPTDPGTAAPGSTEAEVPTARTSIDLSSLDPVTQERFRVLRRLVGDTKSEEEILALARKGPDAGAASSSHSQSRRGWFRRR